MRHAGIIFKKPVKMPQIKEKNTLKILISHDSFEEVE